MGEDGTTLKISSVFLSVAVAQQRHLGLQGCQGQTGRHSEASLGPQGK